MIEKRADCLDILQQTRAVAGLLQSVQKNITQDHLAECFEDTSKFSTKEEKQKLLENVTQVITLVNK